MVKNTMPSTMARKVNTNSKKESMGKSSYHLKKKRWHLQITMKILKRKTREKISQPCSDRNRQRQNRQTRAPSLRSNKIENKLLHSDNRCHLASLLLLDSQHPLASPNLLDKAPHLDPLLWDNPLRSVSQALSVSLLHSVNHLLSGSPLLLVSLPLWLSLPHSVKKNHCPSKRC